MIGWLNHCALDGIFTHDLIIYFFDIFFTYIYHITTGAGLCPQYFCRARDSQSILDHMQMSWEQDSGSNQGAILPQAAH